MLENAKMKLLAVAIAAIGAVLVSLPASAQYYPGPPVVVVPAPVPAPYYRPYYAPPRPYYRPAYRRNPCPPYWTVQSGVCKPYRGY